MHVTDLESLNFSPSLLKERSFYCTLYWQTAVSFLPGSLDVVFDISSVNSPQGWEWKGQKAPNVDNNMSLVRGKGQRTRGGQRGTGTRLQEPLAEGVKQSQRSCCVGGSRLRGSPSGACPGSVHHLQGRTRRASMGQLCPLESDRPRALVLAPHL